MYFGFGRKFVSGDKKPCLVNPNEVMDTAKICLFRSNFQNSFIKFPFDLEGKSGPTSGLRLYRITGKGLLFVIKIERLDGKVFSQEPSESANKFGRYVLSKQPECL